MTVELIGIITLALGLLGLFRPEPFMVQLFLSSTLLGSSAAIILVGLGGTNISPGHLLLGFLAYRLLSTHRVYRAAVNSMTLGTPGFWMLLTAVYGAVSAYFMPRLFAGQTFTFAVRNIEGGYSTSLAPAMSNLTQSIYFGGDLACFVLLYAYAGTISGRRVLGGAVVWCAALNLVFAALDLATYFTNTTELMSVIRNANYGLLNDQEVAGFKRIVGSFTEASSFGSATLAYFAFVSRLWLLGVRPRLSLILTLLSLSALLFSTSTTAYVGLAAFLLVSYLQILFVALRKRFTFQMSIFVFVVPIALASLVIMIAMNDAYWSSLQDLLNTFVLDKMSTDSGIERSSWNRQAWQNLFDTFGFGVGNGSVRASSFPVAVVASLGIVGATMYAMFFIKVLVSRSTTSPYDPLGDAYRQAAKSVCVAWLIAATVSGALIDLSLPYYAFAALASVDPLPPDVEK
jgi:hypothetical protein